MDTTMMSEIEYINIFPDMEKLDQEMDDSSFLKGSFVDKSGPHIKMNHKRIESMDVSKIEENKMQGNAGEGLMEKIGELEQLVESQKKEITKLTLKSEENTVSEVRDVREEAKEEREVREEMEKVIQLLQEQLNRESFMKEKLILEYQLKFKEEKEQMERLIETNVDKKMVLDLESKSKLLHEKNKTLFSEVVSLRKDVESKDNELEKTQFKLSQVEKQLVLFKR